MYTAFFWQELLFSGDLFALPRDRISVYNERRFLQHSVAYLMPAKLLIQYRSRITIYPRPLQRLHVHREALVLSSVVVLRFDPDDFQSLLLSGFLLISRKRYLAHPVLIWRSGYFLLLCFFPFSFRENRYHLSTEVPAIQHFYSAIMRFYNISILSVSLRKDNRKFSLKNKVSCRWW